MCTIKQNTLLKARDHKIWVFNQKKKKNLTLLSSTVKDKRVEKNYFSQEQRITNERNSKIRQMKAVQEA